MKTCFRCKITKELIAFSKDKKSKDGHCFDCKECKRKLFKKWYDANIDHVRKKTIETKEQRKQYYQNPVNKKRYHLARIKREFGIDIAEYERLIKEQNNKCAICGELESGRNTNLSVDHCHKTNKIRGLLCNTCNTGIGLLNDCPKTLQSAIQYLNKHQIPTKTNYA